VIGPDRLPSFEDEGKIPYVEALVMEALRWRPVTPLAVPHYTRSADIYKGYYIPANTIILGNSWAILHDPATYGEDADQFRPERFLNADGMLNHEVPYPDAGFGFGRRACPGKPLAQSALWLYVASLLACFDITKAINENGEEIDPSTDYLDGFLLYPRPFKCIIQPRSKVAEGLIRQK
jgi:cytochrome P450